MVAYMTELMNKFGAWVLALLPHSPFQSFIKACSDMPALGWLNWFIPVGQIIAISEAWLVAIGLFYLYSTILRWLDMIE